MTRSERITKEIRHLDTVLEMHEATVEGIAAKQWELRGGCQHEYWLVIDVSEWSWEGNEACRHCGHLRGGFKGYPPPDVLDRVAGTIAVYSREAKWALLEKWWELPAAARKQDKLRPFDQYDYQSGKTCRRCGSEVRERLCWRRTCELGPGL